MTTHPHQALVHHRHVLYVAGFDPQTARHYHARYRTEAARQEKISGVGVLVGVRQTDEDGYAFWILTTEEQGQTVHTRYTFMDWGDIVRAHWPGDWWRVWWTGLLANLVMVRCGVLRRMLHAAWPPVLACFAPLAALLLALTVSAVLGMVAWAAHGLHLPSGWTAAMFGLIVLALSVAGHRLVKHIGVVWLIRSVRFNALFVRGGVPQLALRTTAHALKLRKMLGSLPQAPASELLLVGHSSGATVAVSMLAEALREDPDLGSRGPQVSLLTLGQCMPLLGCFPQAVAFRRDLATVAQGRDLDWIDFSAPPDASCFPLTDPIRACSVEVQSRPPDRPKLLSPQFANMCTPEGYWKLKRNRLGMHFQYLNACELPVAYDYFQITAGRRTLGSRFAAHVSVNGFTRLLIWKSVPPPHADV